MRPDPKPSKALTSTPPSNTEASVNELGEENIDVSAGEERVAMVEVTRKIVEILGRHMNLVDEKFKPLEVSLLRRPRTFVRSWRVAREMISR